MRTVDARRISTGPTDRPGEGWPTTSVNESIDVLIEAPLTIDAGDLGSYTVLCTPDCRRALAVGFLLSEGMIRSMADIAFIDECADATSVIRVRLSEDIPKAAVSGRNLLVVSSCGACGSKDLDERLRALPEVDDTLRLDRRHLRAVGLALRDKQQLFDACGASHAAAVFDEDGKILSLAEDAGRHNALDKAIGKCLLSGIPPAGCGVMLSSRVSMEMVSRCARAGVELVAAISAPTSLAVDLADRCDITLCAFVRETRATIFTHPRRVVESAV